MIKRNRGLTITVATIMLIVGLGALVWGGLATIQIQTISTSFMGQLSMASGQLNRHDIARTISTAETAMTLGAIIGVAGIILLVAGIVSKPKNQDAG